MHQEFMADCDNAAEQIQQIIRCCNVLQNMAFKRQMVVCLTNLAEEFKTVRSCESSDFDIADFCRKIDSLISQMTEMNSRIADKRKREALLAEITAFTESFARISCKLKRLAEMKQRNANRPCTGANCNRRNIKF